MIAQLCGFVGMLLLAAAPTPPQIFGRCEGLGSATPGLAPKLTCFPIACAPGCVKSAVMTPFGAGQVCNCNYIGPQPDCCKLVFVPGVPGFSKQGDCNAPGCPKPGTCALIVLPPVVPGGAVEYFVDCVKIVDADDEH